MWKNRKRKILENMTRNPEIFYQDCTRGSANMNNIDRRGNKIRWWTVRQNIQDILDIFKDNVAQKLFNHMILLL